MHFRRYFLLLALALPAFCEAQLGFTIMGGRKRVQFPIEICSNLVVIPVVLNGQLPLKLSWILEYAQLFSQRKPLAIF